MVDLREKKWTDGSAYRASKAKNVKYFQTQYAFIQLQTINANLRIEGYANDRIFVGSYIAPGCSNEELGGLLLKVYQCCKHLTQDGLV